MAVPFRPGQEIRRHGRADWPRPAHGDALDLARPRDPRDATAQGGVDDLGFQEHARMESPVLGAKAGNREWLVWLG